VKVEAFAITFEVGVRRLLTQIFGLVLSSQAVFQRYPPLFACPQTRVPFSFLPRIEPVKDDFHVRELLKLFEIAGPCPNIPSLVLLEDFARS